MQTPSKLNVASTGDDKTEIVTDTASCEKKGEGTGVLGQESTGTVFPPSDAAVGI
jgi:hypothetical protein